MKTIRLYILLCIITLATPVRSQADYLGSLNRSLYLARVKLVDEFFARFNGEEFRPDINQNYANRIDGILLLLDLQKYESKNDSNFVRASEFAQRAAEDSVKLNFEDRDWYAKIQCKGKLNKADVSFAMYLTVEDRGNSMYRWAISAVDGDVFLTSRDRPHNELFIMPNDDEQFFQSVPRITTETYQFIDDYVKESYTADPLSVFLTLVRSNQLKIEKIDDVEFVFMQVPEYIFTVKYFDRDNMNAGWLINSITKCEEKK
jgi:hypothetical protein